MFYILNISFLFQIGEKFEWKLVRWMRYEKNKPGVLQYKSSLELNEDFKELNINQRRQKKSNYTLTKSYLDPLPISFNKKSDLVSLLPLINPEFHHFYQKLKVEGECLIEVDSDLDEEDYVGE